MKASVQKECRRPYVAAVLAVVLTAVGSLIYSKFHWEQESERRFIEYRGAASVETAPAVARLESAE